MGRGGISINPLMGSWGEYTFRRPNEGGGKSHSHLRELSGGTTHSFKESLQYKGGHHYKDVPPKRGANINIRGF